MYSLMVKKDFIAMHFLIGGDWGKENEPHAHAYSLELELEGKSLDQNQYLVDIVEVNEQLTTIINRYQDKTLNDLREFHDKNPSIELFSKIICETLNHTIQASNIAALRVRLWEGPEAWSSYRIER